MNPTRAIGRRAIRILIIVAVILALGFIAWTLWKPGIDVRDGRHDRGSNAIWMAHGWLGGDSWFIENRKTNEFARYRAPAKIAAKADWLRRHHVSQVYPHLCPAKPDGSLPEIDAAQVERFLDSFAGIKVIPWIGGPNDAPVALGNKKWRTNFANSIQVLLQTHPRLAGVQVNVEPLPDGTPEFLAMLEEVRAVMPPGKILSVAAYPPPTRWHPFKDVHWSEGYFRQVVQRVDEVAVMMYDTSLSSSKLYQNLMADWTEEVVAWSEGKKVLLGVPTYSDAGVGYHDPKAENLANALLGVHRGLSRSGVPTTYAGVAIYCDWETDDAEWEHLKEHFLKR